jgi:hypothetical protein
MIKPLIGQLNAIDWGPRPEGFDVNWWLWVNYNTGNHPKIASVRFLNYYKLPRLMREKIEDEWKNTKTSRIESNFYFFFGGWK